VSLLHKLVIEQCTPRGCTSSHSQSASSTVWRLPHRLSLRAPQLSCLRTRPSPLYAHPVLRLFPVRTLVPRVQDNRDPSGPLRCPVLDRYTDRGTIALSKVEQGTLRAGSKVTLHTGNRLFLVFSPLWPCVLVTGSIATQKVRCCKVHSTIALSKVEQATLRAGSKVTLRTLAMI
jgi:hypothetical protein